MKGIPGAISPEDGARLAKAMADFDEREESFPPPRLEDPSEQAAAFAQALVGIIRSQQRRIEVLTHELNELRSAR